MDDIAQVKVAFEKLRELTFPDHAVSDDLEDWLMRLVELDAYIAGIASTVASGGRSHWRVDQQDVARLRQDLTSIELMEPTDLDLREQIHGYLDALDNLAGLLG